MSIVYWLKICLRFLKLKHTIYSIVKISSAYQKPTILEEDKSFHLNGSNLLRVDHPNNTKRGGVCIYCKESLGVCEVKLPNLSQCVICEVSLQNCKGYIGVAYRSPNQDSTKFEKFLSDFDELLSVLYKTASRTNSLFTIILGTFTSLHNFHQLISEPTHLLPHSSSCINLSFTDQPNLLVNCSTHSSLIPNVITRLHIVNLISILSIPLHMNN